MIDLHMHLNGSLNAKTIIKLAKKHNIELPTYNEEELKSLISVPIDCESLNDYLKCTKIPRLVTQTKEGIKDAVFELLEELKTQNFIYAEIRFAPQRHRDNGLTQEEVVQAAIKGLEESDLKANLILCCMRGNNIFEDNIETVNLAKKYLGKGVCGVDLAGAEAIYPTENFKDVFDYAKQLEVPITIHAGEAAGAESINTALDFGATRIGHGIRALQDENVMKRIIDNGIILEMCPTSNFQTKAVENKKEYPLREFLKRGIKVTINTDNKTISNTNLDGEFKFLKKEFGLTEEEKLLLLNNSIDGAFISNEEKDELRQILREKYNS